MATTHLHDDDERTTAMGLARYAEEFMLAALAADEKMGRRGGFEVIAPVPVMFLTGQAIELTLKSFLLSKGIALRTLRYDFGHQLHRSMRKAKELGLRDLVALNAEEEGVIELLDALYSTKQLQYSVTGYKTYPSYGLLERAALRLIHAISPAVGRRPPDLPAVHGT